MSTSLRAFFMFKRYTDEWDIQVFHKLEDVIDCWENNEGSYAAAVLHVGFERRAARSFDSLICEYSGRLLLTPGARGALPASYRSSEHPIGHVEEEAIYLALSGWGYEADEPSSYHKTKEAAKFEAWLASYILDHADDVESLTAHSIFDEDKYQQNESELSTELRRKLGKFRLRALCDVNNNDPTAIARASPPWFIERNLAELDLTVRLSNVFNRIGIGKVSDLALLQCSDLLDFQNFGRSSLRHLSEILLRSMDQGPTGLERGAQEPNSGTLIEAVEGSLAKLPERVSAILIRRMGFNCQPQTLAEIGDVYGVTRERIRQIESKALKRLIRIEVWDNLLEQRLKAMLIDREFPLPLIGVEAVDVWFTGVAANSHMTRYIISNMTDGKVGIVEVGGVEYLAFLNQDRWNSIVSSAQRLLANNIHARWTQADCAEYVSALVPEESKEFRSLLWDQAAKSCQFSENDGASILTAFGRGADQVVEAVLAESEEPLHFTEISMLASKRAGRHIDERRAHSAAAEVGYLFARGTYGTLHHLSVSRAEREAISSEAVEIVMDGSPGRQWHTSEILAALLERDVPVPSAFDKYQLDIALKESGQIHSLGRMAWGSDNTVGDGARIEVKQTVVAILEQAGTPLTTMEVRQRLIAVRGLNDDMQVAVSDPLIKLDTSTWGLNDRDLQVKRANQSEYLDGIVERLREINRGVHISECAEIFGHVVPPRALFCLAANDVRMELTSDRRLQLKA